MRSAGVGLVPGIEGGGFAAGAGFSSVVVAAGGAVGKGATDEAGLGGFGATGLTLGAVWLVGVGRGCCGVVAAGFGCPKAEVSAASSSAAGQKGRSTRYV